MNNPLVSICVPVYNVSKYIERCADSLFEQTYNNIEYIFVDDQSPDDSIGLLESILKKYTQRVSQTKVIHHQKNKGLAAARNTALDNAIGEFIMWVDSDDWLDVNAVAHAVNKQLEGDYDIVSFGYKKVFRNNTRDIICEDYKDATQMCLSMIWKGDHHVWARLIRRNLYLENGIKTKEGANLGEDYQVMPLLSYYAKSVANLKEHLYYYNCTNMGSYMAVMSEISKEQLQISEKIVYDFFKGKGLQYENAIKKNEARQLACRLMREGKAVYGDIDQLRSLKPYAEGIALHLKLLFYMPSKTFANLYIAIHENIVNKYKGSSL